MREVRAIIASICALASLLLLPQRSFHPLTRHDKTVERRYMAGNAAMEDYECEECVLLLLRTISMLEQWKSLVGGIALTPNAVINNLRRPLPAYCQQSFTNVKEPRGHCGTTSDIGNQAAGKSKATPIPVMLLCAWNHVGPATHVTITIVRLYPVHGFCHFFSCRYAHVFTLTSKISPMCWYFPRACATSLTAPHLSLRA